MGKWREFLEEGRQVAHKRKIDKNRFCKKNKLGGGRFGSHQYDQDSRYCKLCHHVRENNNGNA